MRPKACRGRDHRLDLSLVAHVDGHHERAAAERSGFLGHRLERRDLARGQDAVGPLPGQAEEIARPMPFAAPVTIAVWSRASSDSSSGARAADRFDGFGGHVAVEPIAVQELGRAGSASP